MNVFGFSYSALIAPIGLDGFRVSPTLVGALAAAEPIGAIAIGTALSAGWLRLDGSRALLQGSLLFLVGVVVTRTIHVRSVNSEDGTDVAADADAVL